MKSIVLLTLSLISLGNAEGLADFQWKKRILVVTAGNERLARDLASAHAGLKEREVKIFTLQGPAGQGQVPDAALAKELRERLKVRDRLAEVLLLGKDGRTTLRWKSSEFSPAALFASIDAMPMRQSEMRVR